MVNKCKKGVLEAFLVALEYTYQLQVLKVTKYLNTRRRLQTRTARWIEFRGVPLDFRSQLSFPRK